MSGPWGAGQATKPASRGDPWGGMLGASSATPLHMRHDAVPYAVGAASIRQNQITGMPAATRAIPRCYFCRKKWARNRGRKTVRPLYVFNHRGLFSGTSSRTIFGADLAPGEAKVETTRSMFPGFVAHGYFEPGVIPPSIRAAARSVLPWVLRAAWTRGTLHISHLPSRTLAQSAGVAIAASRSFQNQRTTIAASTILPVITLALLPSPPHSAAGE